MERFLQGKYPDIADKLETKAVKKSAEETEGAKESKEEAYLERIERIAKTERGGEILRNRYFKESLVDITDDALIDKLAENLFKSEKQQAINEGHGANLPDELSDDMREKYRETILRRLENQKESLERITTYIENNEDGHPLWFRYFMLRSIQNMGTYDAEKNSYLGRTEETIAPFIHLNHEAVGFVRKMLEEKYNIIESLQEQPIAGFSNSDKKRLNALEFRLRKAEVPLTEEEQSIHTELKERYETHKEQEKEEKERQGKIKQEGEDTQFNNLGISFESPDEEKRVRKLFSERLSTESFQDLYAFARKEVYADIKYVTNQGAWRHFVQGSDPRALEAVLENKGTGWCTAAGSAPEHLAGGDFYVYQTYTKEEFARLESGEEVEPTQPAIAVRMLNGEVYEVRGTEPDQGLTPLFNDVAMEQVRKLPGGEKWEKKSADMKLLTKLSKKQEDNEPFTKEELRFLYEIDSEIEGFGYQKDPRIDLLKHGRNQEEDVTTIFDAEGLTARAEDNSWPYDTKVLFGQLEVQNDTKLPEALQYISGNCTINGRLIPSDIATRLIELGECRDVALNLDHFIGLTPDIAHRLIEAGEGERVCEHILCFTDVDYVDMADRMIKAGKGGSVIYHLNKFTSLDHVDFAHRLIDAGEGVSVAKSLNYFSNLDHVDIANRLIEAGEVSWGLVSNLKNFTGLTSDIAKYLIKTGEDWSLHQHLKNFTGLTSDIAKYLIDAGSGFRVGENINSFTGLDHLQIAYYLIEAGKSEHVCKNLDKFTGLDHVDIVKRIIEAGGGDIVATYLDKFTNLTPEVASSLIEVGYNYSVARNLDKFTNLTPEVANSLIEKGDGWAVSNNLNKFTNLDHADIANRMIGAGQGAFVAAELNKFTNLDHEDIVKRLIQSGDSKSVGYYLHNFTGLTSATISRLISSG